MPRVWETGARYRALEEGLRAEGSSDFSSWFLGGLPAWLLLLWPVYAPFNDCLPLSDMGGESQCIAGDGVRGGNTVGASLLFIFELSHKV